MTNESETVIKVLIKVLLAPFVALRWINIKLGGEAARCRWDGHAIEEPDVGVIYSVQHCDRCGGKVRVR